MANDDSRDDSRQQGEADLTRRLNSETAVISWADLVRHFARGVVIHVSVELDLVETAACLARDDTEQVQAWLGSGAMRRASDDDARDWTAREPDFWCVVTAPWVLVQEKQPGSDQPAAGATPTTVH